MTVIPFTPKKAPPDPTTIKVLNISNNIDDILVEAIKSGLSPTEVCAVLTHRLACPILGAEIAENTQLLDQMVDLLLHVHDNGGKVG